MKALSLALLTVVSSALAQDDFASLVKQGDQLDAQLKTTEALAVYLKAEALNPNDSKLLVSIAKQYGESQVDVKSKEEKKNVGLKGLDYSKRAVTADPKNANAYLAVAVSYGRVAPYMDNKTKIAYSKLVKEYADKAKAIDSSSNDLVYHVLGAWNFELANLNPILRAVAQLIYGKLPQASNDIAIENFKKAAEINPRRVGNWVELGRSYAAAGKKDEARAAIEKGLKLPNRERDDPTTKERGKATLKDL